MGGGGGTDVDVCWLLTVPATCRYISGTEGMTEGERERKRE